MTTYFQTIKVSDRFDMHTLEASGGTQVVGYKRTTDSKEDILVI